MEEKDKPDEPSEKKVDGEWKKQARAEKERLGKQAPEEPRVPFVPEPTFTTLVTSLVTQALISLGELKHPTDESQTLDSDGAKFAIDMLQMLKDKTRGNLTPEEGKYLDATLYDLRLRFVAAVSPRKPGEGV
jgi:hypothetical protein